MSIFSFSHCAFKRLILQTCRNQSLLGKWLTLFQTSPGLYVSAVQVFWKHWEKEKLIVTSNFSFSHSVFYPFGELSTIFIKFEIVVCNLFQFGRVSNLSFGKGLRGLAIFSSLPLMFGFLPFLHQSFTKIYNIFQHHGSICLTFISLYLSKILTFW